MADLAFKYSIQFPENGSSNEEEDDKESFEVIHKNETDDLTPVVILLGWAGCQEKHLKKYTPLYQKKGYITVTVIIPPQMLFFQAYKLTDIAHQLLEQLAKDNVSNHPTIFHVFSNGGSMLYTQLTSLINSSDSKDLHSLAVRGVIFDSTPGKRRIPNAVKAFMGVLQFPDIVRYLLGFCLLVYLCFTRFLRLLLPGILGMEKGFQLYDSMGSDPSQWPQMFLYSKADKIIMAEDVEEMVSVRKERGVSVKSICWDDSEHVAHLRAHPEVYAKACSDFVEGCLKQQG